MIARCSGTRRALCSDTYTDPVHYRDTSYATVLGTPRRASMSFLLRVVLPDRPGMLGAVATALGQSRPTSFQWTSWSGSPGVAVDDLVVELPATGCPTR